MHSFRQHDFTRIRKCVGDTAVEEVEDNPGFLLNPAALA
jgi:hypothetical protein